MNSSIHGRTSTRIYACPQNTCVLTCLSVLDSMWQRNAADPCADMVCFSVSSQMIKCLQNMPEGRVLVHAGFSFLEFAAPARLAACACVCMLVGHDSGQWLAGHTNTLGHEGRVLSACWTRLPRALVVRVAFPTYALRPRVASHAPLDGPVVYNFRYSTPPTDKKHFISTTISQSPSLLGACRRTTVCTVHRLSTAI